ADAKPRTARAPLLSARQVGQGSATRRRDLSARRASRSSVVGGSGLCGGDPRHPHVAVEIGAFGYRQVARLDIAEDFGARPEHDATAADDVAAQLTHYEQS